MYEQSKICVVVNFFISGNFHFSFVWPSLEYITIPRNKRKTTITLDKNLICNVWRLLKLCTSKTFCSVHKFSLLCASLCIYPPLLTSLSGDSCIIFKAQCKFLLGRIYSIRREKFVHTKVENWMSRYAENGRFKNNTDVIRFCLLCSQLFLFSRRFQRQTTINLKLKNFSHSHHLLSSSPSQWIGLWQTSLTCT